MSIGGAIEREAQRLRETAERGPIGKRKSSFELYRLLQECMRLAEYCKGGAEFDEMADLLRRQPRGNRTRRYLERSSDSYTLVCRFVFADLRSASAEGSNASRYAACLRQADENGIKSDILAAYLSTNGGVNALFLTRPRAARSVTTRTLHLRTPVGLPKDQWVRLVVRREADNTCSVHSPPEAVLP